MLSAVCCLTTDYCKGGCIGLSRNQNIKFTYNFVIIFTYIVGIFLNSINENDNTNNFNCENVENQQNCVEERKTSLDFFSLSVFHLILMFCMVSKSKHVKIINQGLWLAKIVVLIGLILIFSIFESVASYIQFFMLWGSPLLYCLVNMVIIDLVYSFDISLEQRAQNNNKLYVFKAILTIIIWICAIVCNIFTYYYSLEYIAIINSILLGVFLIIAFLRVSRCNSLLVYAMLGLYFNLIVFNIHSQNEERPTLLTSFQHIFRLVVAFILLFGMLFQGGNKLRTKNSTFNEMLALNTSQKQQDNRYVSSNKWTIYHYIMAMICFTLPSLICYDSPSLSPAEDTIFDIGKLAWLISAVLLYSWSIICQKIYPQKDFSQLQNYFKEYQLN